MGQVTSRQSLQPSELTSLTSCTGFSPSTIIEWHKVFLSAAPTGFLSEDSFLALYTRIFPQGDPRLICHQVFRSFGATRHGRLQVTFREYLVAMHETMHGSEEDRMRRAFKMFDRNERGVIDEQDLLHVYMAVMNLSPQTNMGDCAKEARALMDILDPGHLGQVTLPMFLQAIGVQPSATHVAINVP